MRSRDHTSSRHIVVQCSSMGTSGGSQRGLTKLRAREGGEEIQEGEVDNISELRL